jgi:hypothetical protein
MRKGEIRTQGNYSEGEGATITRPWRLDHSTVLDNDGNPVAIIAAPAGDGGGERIEWPWVYDEAPPASYAQAEDNARLIASAPELLSALTVALTADECPCCGRDNTGHDRCTSDDCPGVQAIAKATVVLRSYGKRGE